MLLKEQEESTDKVKFYDMEEDSQTVVTLSDLRDWAESLGVAGLPLVIGPSVLFYWQGGNVVDNPVDILEIDYGPNGAPELLRICTHWPEPNPEAFPDCHEFDAGQTLDTLKQWADANGCSNVPLFFAPSRTAKISASEPDVDMSENHHIYLDAPIRAVEIDVEDGHPVRVRVIEYDAAVEDMGLTVLDCPPPAAAWA